MWGSGIPAEVRGHEFFRSFFTPSLPCLILTSCPSNLTFSSVEHAVSGSNSAPTILCFSIPTGRSATRLLSAALTSRSSPPYRSKTIREIILLISPTMAVCSRCSKSFQGDELHCPSCEEFVNQVRLEDYGVFCTHCGRTMLAGAFEKHSWQILYRERFHPRGRRVRL